MSKFLSGRQSNLKLGVAGYTESKTVLETTGKVGIGTTDAQSYSLYVVGDTNVTGLVSATAFYGDGSNLENTGATLSAYCWNTKISSLVLLAARWLMLLLTAT